LAKSNGFDDLLASITTPEDRQALTEIADRVPVLRDSVMMRSEFSRGMDSLRAEKATVKDQLEFAEQMAQWHKEHWVPDAYGQGKGATRRELEAKAQFDRIAEENRQLAAKIEAGENVTFDEINSHVEKLMADRGVLGKAEFEKTAAGFQQNVESMLVGYTKLATALPMVVVNHFKEFGETLDTDKLIEFAAAKGIGDARQAYDGFIQDRRAEKSAAAQAEAIEAAKKQGREEALRERGMSPDAMPDDTSGPQMGPFQRRLLGLDKDKTSSVPEDAELGRGALAAVASREWDRGK
jgi:hypothetical protein